MRSLSFHCPFTVLSAGGMEGPESACVEFGDTHTTPRPAATHGVSPCSPGVSVSGDNLVEGLYCGELSMHVPSRLRQSLVRWLDWTATTRDTLRARKNREKTC